MAFNTMDIADVSRNGLWVIYGRSNSGKDVVASTFPKPLLHIPIGDDGRASIRKVKGIRTLKKPITTMKGLKKAAEDAVADTKFKTIVVSTFSLLTSEWKSEMVAAKGKRMTQQLWGDLMSDTEELIRLFKEAAKTHEIVLICHEAMDDQIEDMEDEIVPNIRPNVTRGARAYLEGVANFGIHCVKFSKEVEDKEGNTTTKVRYGCHIGPNPYYWTKVQCDPKVKVPESIINPSYKKVLAALGE